MNRTKHQASGTKHSATGASRFFLGLFLGLMLCFAMQAVCYYGLGGRAGKGESNYFSTLGRFQAAAQPAAEMAFAGSSISGRLPGREAGNTGIANLGSDGGAALDGIRLINMDRVNVPKYLIIEANTLYGSLDNGNNLVIDGAKGRWFNVGVQIPILSAMARPSAMIYSSLLRRVNKDGVDIYEIIIDTVPESATEQLFVMSDSEKLRLASYIEELDKLDSRGCKIILINYPAGVKKEREDWLMRFSINKIAKKIPIHYIDLEKQIPRHELEFTDPVHLAPASAAKIVRTIRSIIDSSIIK